MDVVDQSMSEKRQLLEAQDADPAQQRRTQGALYAEEVKACTPRHCHGCPMLIVSGLPVISYQRNQVHNELTVERIVRNRSLDGELCHVRR